MTELQKEYLQQEKRFSELLAVDNPDHINIKEAVKVSNWLRRHGSYNPDIILNIYRMYNRSKDRLQELWDIEQPTEEEVDEFTETSTWLQLNARYNPNKRVINPVQTEKFKKKPDDDVFTLASWKKMVDAGAFIDYDGWGYLIVDGHMTDTSIYPSDYLAHPAIFHNVVGKIKILWLNR